jgi:hypothetical protein
MLHVSFRSIKFTSCFACVIALGCGGAATRSEAPALTPKASAGPHETHAASPATSQPSPAVAETPADPVITRTVADRVFAPRIAYMVNYPVSGAKDVADHKCSVKFPAPEAKAACMEKERGKFSADVLVFEKSDEGQSVIIYKRSGNALQQMSKSKVVLADDTTEKLSIKVDSDHGWRPLFAGKKAFDVRFRDEYSIVLDEPQYGPLVYDARIGLID